MSLCAARYANVHTVLCTCTYVQPRRLLGKLLGTTWGHQNRDMWELLLSPRHCFQTLHPSHGNFHSGWRARSHARTIERFGMPARQWLLLPRCRRWLSAAVTLFLTITATAASEAAAPTAGAESQGSALPTTDGSKTDAESATYTAQDVMRLMRGGRGRKALHSHAAPKPSEERCFSAEPGAQRGRWSDVDDAVEWIPNERCRNLQSYDENQLFGCLFSFHPASSAPVAGSTQGTWLVLAGDSNMRGIYYCVSGKWCPGIQAHFAQLGYGSLHFEGVSDGSHGDSRWADEDTVYWPPAGSKLPPIRISLRFMGGYRRYLDTDAAPDWRLMRESDGTVQAEQPWLHSHQIVWGDKPDALLFSTGRWMTPQVQTKDCSVAKSAAKFLRNANAKRVLWASANAGFGRKLPSRHQVRRDAECDREHAKHNRIPFLDLFGMSEAAIRLPSAPTFFQNDGYHMGWILNREVLRFWTRQMCLKDTP